MLLEQLIPNFTKDKELIFDLYSDTSTSLLGLNSRIGKVISYFEDIIKYKSGDKIAIFMENSADYITILLALFELDVIIVPLNPKLNKEKLEFFLKHSQSRFFITSHEILNKSLWLGGVDCQAIVAEDILKICSNLTSLDIPRQNDCVNEESLKFIFYTSGTTGSPKGVMLSSVAVKTKILSLISLLGLDPSLSFFSFLPFYSGHGMIPGMLVPLLSGCKIYVGKFDPFLVPKFWELIKKYNINYFTSVPSVLSLVKDNIQSIKKEEIANLTNVFSASAPLPQNIYNWYYDYLGIKIRNCYGLTETASWVSVSSSDTCERSSNCVGKPSNCEIMIFDQDRNRLDPGKIGELWVKGPSNMSGYYNNADETKLAIVDGCIRTGDLGYIDPEGSVFILDRIKNIIKRNGITITPQEIDQVFLEHSNVKDSVSFGISDKDYGERLITALVLRNKSCLKDEYFKYAIDRLPTFLVPNDFFIVDHIRKGPTGKVQLDLLREQYLSRR
jgi:acyl-CoA synthetase (AMP-forming)/AMP-acid ligase II